jgi:hypothetical protein
MPTRKNSKLLNLIIIGLLSLSLVVISIMFVGKPKDQGPRDFIIESLHFDDRQVVEFDKIIHLHHNKARLTVHRKDALKRELFNTLSEKKQKNTDSLIDLIGQVEMKIEKLNYAHLQDLKSICKKDQLNDFKELSRSFPYLFEQRKLKK